MKKIILTLIFALIISLNINAQQWNVINNNADELKGTPAFTSYIWIEKNGGFGYKDIDNTMFFIKTSEGIFNSNGRRGQKGRPLIVGLVGFYNLKDSLIDKMEITYEITEDYQSVYPNKYTYKGGNNYKRARKIIDYIKNNDGYIRFIIPRYAKGNFELKVLCNKQH